MKGVYRKGFTIVRRAAIIERVILLPVKRTSSPAAVPRRCAGSLRLPGDVLSFLSRLRRRFHVESEELLVVVAVTCMKCLSSLLEATHC
jgi:hypothetical protein